MAHTNVQDQDYHDLGDEEYSDQSEETTPKLSKKTFMPYETSYKPLEDFIFNLKLPLTLVDILDECQIDLGLMLSWEDPKRELELVGITQRGVVTKILRGLEAERAREDDIECDPTTIAIAPRVASPRVIKKNRLSVTVGVLFGTIIALPEARSKISLLSSEYDLYVSTFLQKNSEKRSSKNTHVVRTPNTRPLCPCWESPDGQFPTNDIFFEPGWTFTIQIFEPGTIRDLMIGEAKISYEKLLSYQNGEWWIPLKFGDGECAGEIFISLNGLPTSEIIPIPWQVDTEVSEEVDYYEFDLVQDYDLQAPRARLSRVLSKKDSDLAVLYLPTFSDYFWQVDTAITFCEEGFHFYALEPRRYSRTVDFSTGHPYLIKNLMEYYEEIHQSIDILRNFEGIRNVVLAGNGVGATTAALFAKDNPTEIDGLLLNSPLVTLSPEIPGFSKPGWFSEFDTEAGFVCEAYHRSLHVQHHGVYEWNLNFKPIFGHVIYSAWLDAVTDAIQRISTNFTLDVPTLVLSATRHVPSLKFVPALLAADAIQPVEEIWRLAGTWGPKVRLTKIKDAVHDVFLSDGNAREEAFDAFCDFFLWLSDPSVGAPYQEQLM